MPEDNVLSEVDSAISSVEKEYNTLVSWVFNHPETWTDATMKITSKRVKKLIRLSQKLGASLKNRAKRPKR